ncbi:SurA N-terminal domain-containing protein [Epilithonimonas ginsengisoli]|uniref:Periplasmic chaperone PpiD n=1 Tax=Epilithonimonas ginsengisoli TaxID=1245592 RepID=A0ABU4JEP5_9FLAO|nr:MULTISPECIES: peptidylprolyl isomerase [Chryseobacterium group]MBV6879502.1 SurA N-terminal domain-containing protein [Epilithonimonas sp. FP105]MDW8548138.1 SurA N-terminal domain-containing protein [Epilithonimonas ginsengisoli]OAH64424.1 peptidylprolyl isomerase [Chryseobacterium sp. FP211-J200]
MAILGEIRKRSWLLVGVIALALLAFLVNPDTIDKVFGKNPNILGKVNGEEITRDELNDQLFIMQQQAQQQGQPTKGLEEQAWQILVQSKLIKQQFEKTGLTLSDETFWSQLQYDPIFAQNQQYFDEKGNFKLKDIKGEIEKSQATNPENYTFWLKNRKAIEYRMMARMLFGNITSGITTSKKEAELMVKFRDEMANIDFVKVDYLEFSKKNNVKVTTQDLADYIKLHPTRFKATASRNIAYAYFPAAPSAQDDAATLNEINKLFLKGTDASNGAENFQNTTNDSMFVELNSDVPFIPQYVSPAQLPTELKDKIATAAIGQTFGPYKEQTLYVVSKLLDKKASDSTLSKHILIGYKGAERSTATRTKEAAKKTADSLLAVIKADPAKFAEGLKLSDEPNAVERNGSVGWTTPASQFAPGYLSFLANNAKGTTGLQETAFGYHIINVEDKKSGAMTYKIAHLAKNIKASDKTENQVLTQATRFIQQTQGKSFNQFKNLAEKNKYKFDNPKMVGRFQGTLPGIGTDKDGDVIAWAFDKKREIGDTDIFTVEGTGDRIVAYVVGKQDEGLADPETVRDQIEPIVKNKVLAKKILEKINAGKYASLDQAAKALGTTKASAAVNVFNPSVNGAMEPKVAGAAFGVAVNKLSQPIEGMTGVYLVVKKSVTTNKLPGDIKQITESITQQNSQQFTGAFLKSLQDNAKIKDYRIEVWDKSPQQ